MWVTKVAIGVGVLLLAGGMATRLGIFAHQPRATQPPESRQGEGGKKASGETETAIPANKERTGVDLHGDPLPPGATARLGTVRLRDEGWVSRFAISPDGGTLATVAGKNLSFWEAATGRPVRWVCLASAVQCVAYAPDGKAVAVGCGDGIVRLIDVATGKETRQIVGHEAGRNAFKGVWGVVFTPKGDTLLSWGSDGTARLWEASLGKELRRFDSIKVESLSPDGKLLAAIAREGDERGVVLWNVETGAQVRKLVHPLTIGRVAFSPDGKTLATAVGEPARKIILWDITAGKETGTLSGHDDAVLALAFSPDGKVLVSGGSDKTIRRWDVHAGKEVCKALRLPTPVYELAITPDGKTLVSRGAENRVRLWDLASWQERAMPDAPEWSVPSIAYSPEGKQLASASRTTVWLWDSSTGQVIRKLEGHEDTVRAVAFSPDGKTLASASDDSTVRLWDPVSGKEQSCLLPPSRGVSQIAVSPDGMTVATWGHPERAINLMHTGTGKQLGSLNVPSLQPQAIPSVSWISFSSDGKTVWATSDTNNVVLRWDVATRKELPPIGEHDGALNGAALAPDDRSVAAVTTGGILYLWETATRQPRLVVKDAGYSTAVAFSADGRLLALANNGLHRRHRFVNGKDTVTEQDEGREEVRLVAVSNGQVIHRFRGHAGGIGCLSFSPDGRTLASGSLDTTVLLWDVAAGTAASPKGGKPPSREELDSWWLDLRKDAARAHRAMVALTSHPVPSVPFLGERLMPVAPADATKVAALLKLLDSDTFTERESAARELQKLGDTAESALRKALRENLSAEARRRLEQILEELIAVSAGTERVRTLRAVEVLERINDESARGVLRRLAGGEPEAWLTQEAKLSLQRIEGKDKVHP